MKKVVSFFVSFLWLILPIESRVFAGSAINIQDSTFALQEVTVAVILPLSDVEVLDFYRSNEFSSIDNIMARMEDMSLIKRGAYAMEPMINGFSGGQINVTIDGMKMFGACTDKMDPITSYIEPSNLKSITISDGTTGCSTGCNIGGQMDMTLAEPRLLNQKPIYGSIATGFESNSSGNTVLATLGGNSRKWGWLLDGVYRKNQNYTDGNGSIVPFSQFEKYNLHSAISYNATKISSFKLDMLYDNATNVGYPALPMDVSLASASLVALEYQKKGKVELKFKAYYNDIIHIMDDSQRDSLFHLDVKPEGKSDSVYMRMDMPGRSSTLGAYLQLSTYWRERNKFLVKLDNYSNQSIAEMTMHMRYAGLLPEAPMYMQTWPANLRNVTGLYLENSSFLSTNFVMIASLRMDYNTDVLLSEYGHQQFTIFNYNLPPMQSKFLKSVNLAANYRFAKNVSMDAKVGYAERMPSITERLGFYLFNAYDGYDYIGNPNLRTEKSTFFKLGFQFSNSKIKLNINNSISYIEDYILGLINETIPAMNFYTNGIKQYSNFSSAMLYSLNVQGIYTPSKSLTAFWTSKFTWGEIANAKAMPLIPPLKNIIAIKYEHKNLYGQLECQSSLAQNRINTDFGEKITSGYTIFNIKSGYKLQLKSFLLSVGMGVTNIFNRKYYEHLDWGRIYRPGRSLELYTQLSF